MERKQYRWLHKWIFIFMGALVVIWCLTGIVMVTPEHWFGKTRPTGRTAVDYRNIAVSPADALHSLEQHTGSQLEVRNIELIHADNQIIYRIYTRENGIEFVDAQTGEYFEFTPEIVEQIVRKIYKIHAPAEEIVRLTEHDTSYPWGQLPAYRLHFSNNEKIWYFFSENNAGISRSTTGSRLRNAIISLHTFEPIEFFIDSPQLRISILVLTSILTVLGAIIGYILTLPARRRIKQRTD